jgi:hypothetical protein
MVGFLAISLATQPPIASIVLVPAGGTPSLQSFPFNEANKSANASVALRRASPMDP